MSSFDDSDLSVTEMEDAVEGGVTDNDNDSPSHGPAAPDTPGGETKAEKVR